MNLAGDAGPLSQYRPELRSQPAHAEPKHQPREHSQAEHEDRVKPIGLIEVWFQVKTESSAAFIPNAIVVTGDNTERVSSGTQISVVSDATRAAIDPVPVKAFQLVLEPDLLRRHEARRRVVEVKASCTCRQLDAIR